MNLKLLPVCIIGIMLYCVNALYSRLPEKKRTQSRVRLLPKDERLFAQMCQIRSLYSRIVLSLEKMPLFAVLITAMRSHLSRSV